MNTDVFIVGKGPAGISAALYTVRAGFSTVVTGKDMGALGKAKQIDNYYGFAEGISAEALFQQGIQGAERLGVAVLDEEVFDISWSDGRFHITTDQQTHESRVVILATGAGRKSPPIHGLKEWEGKGVSYCAVCDGFFFREKHVGIIGNGAYAVSEALHLLPTSSQVTLLTNGKSLTHDAQEKVNQLNGSDAHHVSVDERHILEIQGDSMVNAVCFEDNTSLPLQGVFVAEGAASATDLARKLGAANPQGTLFLKEDMSTNVPGFFAAGDCTGGLLQVAKAVYDGAVAGTSAGRFLRETPSTP